MSNQLRVQALLREAANLLNDSAPRNSVSASSSSASTTSQQLETATRALFQPYRAGPAYRGRRRGRAEPPVTFWSHRFCALAVCSQDVVPTREEKSRLLFAGLGEKKITFIKSADPEQFKEKLEEIFPKLKSCGGFELMRSAACHKFQLEPLLIPKGGYTSCFLSDESGLGQAMCYIRPIQMDMDLENLPDVDNSGDVEEKCLKCGTFISLRGLRDHVTSCTSISPNSASPRMVQLPMCQFTCNSNTESESSGKSSTLPEADKTGVCPICQKVMPVDLLEVHAAACGESLVVKDACDKETTDGSLDDSINDLLTSIENQNGTKWTVNVIRRNFIETTMEQLDEGSEDDWKGCFRVNFIGEEGLDAGGLRREFFSLLFEKSDLLENNSFCLDAAKLAKKHYKLLGRATALAILYGHPGPQYFNEHITQYIVSGVEPEEVHLQSIKRQDIVTAVNDLEDATDISTMVEKYSDILEVSGFRKVLTEGTKTEAIHSVKAHFGFYSVMAPLQQYLEGLQLHGILRIVRSHSVESAAIFGNFLSTGDSRDLTEKVQKFFKPSFSDKDEEKKLEEMIIYNFSKFLRKVERGGVQTMWLEEDNEAEKLVTLEMRHVLRAFLGCDSLPRDIPAGVIEFAHNSNNLSSVNTCGPSILFSQTQHIQSYETFESHLMYIIVGAPGFGME